MLQSKAGIENREYQAQRSLLADVDTGKISKEEFFARADQLLRERMPAAHKAAEPRPLPTAAPAAAPESSTVTH
jgi:hypothetical protein